MKKMMALLLSAFLMMPSVLFAGEAAAPVSNAGMQTMTFLDCYAKVLAHYPALKKKYEELAQAKAGKNLAWAELFPKVQGVTSLTTTDDPVGVFGDLLRQESFTARDFELNSLNSPRHRTNYHFGLTGEMLLFDSFNTISKIRSARRLVKSADLEADFTEMEASLVTLESYLAVLHAQELLNITAALKEVVDRDLKQAEDLKQKGMILGADFYAAKVAAAGIERALNRARARVKTSRMFMNILMGEDPVLEWNATGKLSGSAQDKGPLQEWIAQAYQQRKDLVAMDQLIDAQRIESLRQKTSFLPKIYGFGSLDADSHDLRSSGKNFTVGIKGTMDLFDPSYLGRTQQAKHRYEALKADRQALRDEIAKQLIGELASYETVVIDQPVLSQAFQDAKEASDQTAKLYQEGRKSIADLLTIRGVYLETASGLQQLLLALELEHAKLLFLSGQLTEDNLHLVNARLQG
ncbi:MAG: TolC family protein [Candidatus Omnitrophota bacterium]